MQVLKALGAVALVGALFAACGSGTATQAPANATQAAQATEASGPGQTDAGGGPVIVPGNGSGKVHYEISGPVQKSGDLPFFGLASRFEDPAGQYLSFADTNTTGDSNLLAIFHDSSDATKWLVSFASVEFQLTAQACTIKDWETNSTNAKGEFDCPNSFLTKPDGTFDTTARIKGTFEAHK